MRNPYEYPEHCPECGVCPLDDDGRMNEDGADLYCQNPEEHVLCGRHRAEAKEAAAERRWERETGR